LRIVSSADERGDLVVPPDADLLTFLISDGKLSKPAQIKMGLSPGDLFAKFLEDLPPNSLEQNTIYTIKIHLTHIKRLLGERFRIDSLSFSELQRYVDKRSADIGQRGKNISSVTIKKELTSFSAVWTWATRTSQVKFPFPNKELRYAKVDEKPPFQTWAEIQRRIDLGGLSDVETAELWEGLYLTAEEIEQALDHVEKHATIPAIYPMLALAARTGARRSEILRSEVSDFDLCAETVRLRELKRSRGTRTMRTVPLSGRLKSVIEIWLASVKGRHTFSIDGIPLTVDEASHYFN
jgi:integrase